ncbi:hypothetical protein HDU91_003566, partial [Kappamyces sp. JEL0680]
MSGSLHRVSKTLEKLKDNLRTRSLKSVALEDVDHINYSASPSKRNSRVFGSAIMDASQEGRELDDNIVKKLLFMRYSILSVFLNVFLLFVMVELYTKTITIPLGGDVFQRTLPVIFELFLHLCHIVNHEALQKGLAAFFGFMLSRQTGFSLAVAGFYQSDILQKLAFPGLLAYRSRVKRLLSFLSVVYVIHLLFLIASIFAAKGITVASSRIQSGTLQCLEYGQEGSPVDRGIPTLETQSGVAEFLFGTSYGYLSSEGAGSNTTLLVAPQLIDAASDDTIISGAGFSASMEASCACTDSFSVDSVIALSSLSAPVAAKMLSDLSQYGMSPSWANFVELSDDSEIVITTLLGGTS